MRNPEHSTPNRFARALLLVLALASLAAWAAQPPPSPTDQAQFSIDAVIVVLKDESLTSKAKDAKIRAIIEDRFNFQAMSRRTLGRNWKKADKAQQSRFVDLFKEQLARTYLSSLKDYNDQEIKYVGEKIRNKKNKTYAQVDTVIVHNGVDTPVNYRLKLNGDQWEVYDVVIEGVSLISNFRSSYNTIIKREGMESLLEQLEKKLEAADTVTN